MAEAPKVELLWWEGCPSWEGALEMLRHEMAELGLDPESVSVQEIETGEEAEDALFVGSPTIRIDGEDIQPPEQGEAPGLTCRIYRLRDGRLSPLPDRGDLRDALLAAAKGVRAR